MKLAIEESVLRQALEALETIRAQNMTPQIHPAKVALRTALDAAEKVDPVCWCMAYDDPAFGRIHSNPSMCEPELDAHIAKCDGRLVKVPLYTHPAPAVLEGWHLVPKEPTEEMIGAAMGATDYRSMYKLMLAAAPKPES